MSFKRISIAAIVLMAFGCGIDYIVNYLFCGRSVVSVFACFVHNEFVADTLIFHKVVEGYLLIISFEILKFLIDGNVHDFVFGFVKN